VYARRNSESGCSRWNVYQHDGVCADHRKATYSNLAEHFGAGSYGSAAFHYRIAVLTTPAATATKHNARPDHAELFELDMASDHYPRCMWDVRAQRNGGARIDVDSVNREVQLRDQARKHWDSQPAKPVRQTM
jgi:hypothetical protein